MLGKGRNLSESRPLPKARAAFLLVASSAGVAFDESEQISAVDQARRMTLIGIAKARAPDTPSGEEFVNLGAGKPG